MILIGVILVFFVLLRRPLYEAMLVAFLVLLTVTGSWGSAGAYILSAAQNSLLFTIVMFLVFSSILKETGVINDCIDIIMALVGRFHGGTGAVAMMPLLDMALSVYREMTTFGGMGIGAYRPDGETVPARLSPEAAP